MAIGLKFLRNHNSIKLTSNKGEAVTQKTQRPFYYTY
ncbi:MAG: hypothetical protein CM1200mP28_08940 [Deltaproteobacteria bacterium]|nr:MAG: hypothetical protein CM1200mP28_08940 [Deltaproteobacteria bacterium]